MDIAHDLGDVPPALPPADGSGLPLGPLNVRIYANDPRLVARRAGLAAGLCASRGTCEATLTLDLTRSPRLAPPPAPDASWDVWGRTPAWDADVHLHEGAVGARFSFDAAFMRGLAAREDVAVDALLRAALRMTLAVAAPVAGGLLLHGAAMVRPEDGQAFVFVGPSGAGKTTITRRLPGFRAIADDTLLLWRDGDAVLVSGTPLRGREGYPSVVTAAPVGALVRITPGVAPRAFHRLDIAAAFAELLLRTFFYPSARISEALRGRLLEVCAGLAERVPAFSLGSTLADPLLDLFTPGGPSDV